jgi:hypothetical protein
MPGRVVAEPTPGHAGRMDERLSAAPVVADFAGAVRPVAGVVAFYAGGSLATRDYQPGRSDLDLVAIVDRPLTGTDRAELRRLHQRYDPDHPKLHCAYVPRDDAAEVIRKHLAWAHRRLLRRPFSGIARGELQQGGIVVYGPPPAEFLPALDTADLAEAARAELRGYWTGAVRRAGVWRTDVHVDIGLTTLARADATIAEGRLITKREAIARLPQLGVPAELADQIARRRAGEPVTLTATEIHERAVLVRRIMRDGLGRLLRQAHPIGVCDHDHGTENFDV